MIKGLIELLEDVVEEVGSFIFEFLLNRSLEKIIFSGEGVLWVLGVGGALFWIFSRLDAETNAPPRRERPAPRSEGRQPEPLRKMLVPFFVILLVVFLLLASVR